MEELKIFMVLYSRESSMPEFIILIAYTREEAEAAGVALIDGVSGQTIIGIQEIIPDKPSIVAVAHYCC